MRDFLLSHRPALVLAPMQDVTDLPFMRVLARRGAPDWFVTEYFRVHPDSCLHRYILRSIVENETRRPIFAQMIGRDLPGLIRTARELARHPIAGVDLNLGCPAPIVCRKDAGGRFPCARPSPGDSRLRRVSATPATTSFPRCWKFSAVTRSTG